jgi:hypothetical protein
MEKILWAYDLADLWEEAHGEHGRSQLLGAMFANLSEEKIERLANQARKVIESKKGNN